MSCNAFAYFAILNQKISGTMTVDAYSVLYVCDDKYLLFPRNLDC